MGYYFFDKYSLLHFSFGMIWNYLGLDFISLVILHIIFEYVENTKIGIKFIDNCITLWPGGKKHADSLINSITDIIFSALGWIFFEKFKGKIGINELATVAVGNMFFFWASNFQILIFIILALLGFIVFNKVNYIIYLIIGILIGYGISYIDKKLELFS